MALLKTQIANLALGRLGETKRVIDVDADATLAAKILRDHFDTSLETLLEAHPWGFSTGFAALALVSVDPQAEWGYSYRMPTDALVLRQIEVEGNFSDIEKFGDEINKFKEVYDAGGTLLYSNVGDAWAEYTKNLPSSSSFPNFFGRALSAQLALDIAPQIVTNVFSKVKRQIEVDAENAILKAISYDLGRKPPPEQSDSIFIRARK